MNITDEMVDAGARLIAQEHGSEVFWPDHEPNEYTDVEREQYRAEARAVAEFVAPLIAAQALRQAAEEIERGIVENPTEDRAVDAVNLSLEDIAKALRQTCGTDYAPDAP
jgi:hypothetical protein